MEESELLETYKNIVDNLDKKEVVLKGPGAVGEKDLDLEEIEFRLNEVKKKTNFKNRSKWRSHTEWTHPLGKNTVMDYGNLTRAYMKMMDLLIRFPELTDVKQEGGLKSFHICESPGNFVCALGDFLEDRELEWKMNSLNPYYEWNDPSSMLKEDYLIINNISKMIYGKSDSGNIFDFSQRELDLIEKMDLVTADGSVDCTVDPENQERLVSDLIAQEVFIGLNTLRKGGHFILKMFTFFTNRSLEILLRLIGSFERVYVRKPAPSKPSNSEVYVICINFAGEIKDEKAEYHIKRIKHVSEYFSLKQIEMIEFNINSLYISQFLKCQIDEIKNEYINNFFKKFPDKTFSDIHCSKKSFFSNVKNKFSDFRNFDSFNSLEWISSEKFTVIPKEILLNLGPVKNCILGNLNSRKVKLDFCDLKNEETNFSNSANLNTVLEINPWILTKTELIDAVISSVPEVERVVISTPENSHCGILSRFSISLMAILLDIFKLEELPTPGGHILLQKKVIKIYICIQFNNSCI